MAYETKTFTITFRNGDTQIVEAIRYDEKGTFIVFFAYGGAQVLGVPKRDVQSIAMGDTRPRESDVQELD